MLAYQDGEVSAFQELYKRYAPRVYGYLKKRISLTERTDEVFQMVFLKLHKSREKYDASYAFAPWLFTICRTTLIDAIRSGNVFQDHRNEPIEAADKVGTEVHEDDRLEPFDQLPQEQRELLTLRYKDDLSFEQMADRLGSSPVAIRQRISRLVRHLKETRGKS